ncbi:MAG: flagellar assembly protein FliW [Campylobacterota bacterium]
MEYEVVSPIYGFEDVKKMELVKVDDTFFSLKNCDDVKPVFTLVNPFAFREYEFEISDSISQSLGIEDANDVSVLNIMVVSSPIEESRINFAAPLVFNNKTKKVAQIILNEMKYEQYGLAEKISDYLNK